MMPSAQQDEVVYFRFAVVSPENNVMSRATQDWHVAAREGAASVADGERVLLRQRHSAFGAPDVERFARRAEDAGADAGIAGKDPRVRRTDGPDQIQVGFTEIVHQVVVGHGDEDVGGLACLAGEIAAGGLQPHVVGEGVPVAFILGTRIAHAIDGLVRLRHGIQVGFEASVGFQVESRLEAQGAVAVLHKPQLRAGVFRILVAGFFAIRVELVQEAASGASDLPWPSTPGQLDQDLLPGPHVRLGHARRDAGESLDDRVNLATTDRTLRSSFGRQRRKRRFGLTADGRAGVQGQDAVGTGGGFFIRHQEVLEDQARQRRMTATPAHPAGIDFREDRVLLRIRPTLQDFEFLLAGMQGRGIDAPPLGGRPLKCIVAGHDTDITPNRTHELAQTAQEGKLPINGSCEAALKARSALKLRRRHKCLDRRRARLHAWPTPHAQGPELPSPPPPLG